MAGSQNPLRTRQDLREAAAEILRPLTACMTPGKARIYVGNGSAHYPEDVAGMECWSRALWALVPMLAGKCPEAEELWPLWREGMIHGTDPEHEEYWGDIRDSDQRMDLIDQPGRLLRRHGVGTSDRHQRHITGYGRQLTDGIGVSGHVVPDAIH